MNKHRTTWKQYPDEAQEVCLDCGYMRCIPKRLDGSLIEPGRVTQAGDTSAHGGGTYSPAGPPDALPA